MSNDRFKFRAWDNHEKKWLLGYEYPNLGGFSMFGETMLFNEWSQILSRFILQQKDRKPEDLILMQSTGMNDKNGKLIYESDLVKDDNTIFEVVFDHSKYEFKRISGSIQYPYFHDNCKRMQIIGNIWENKEMLLNKTT